MSERSVPFDLTAERSVLASILLDREAIVALAPRLGPDDFYLEKHALIYVAAAACYAAGVPPDLTNVATELRKQENLDIVGGISTLTDLIDTIPTSVHAEYYAEAVRASSLHRQLIEAGGKIVAMGYDQQAGFAAALTSAMTELESITRVWSSGEPVTGISAAQLAHKKIPPVRWIIDGILSEGFGYLGAKPGMGKTWMLLQWAAAVATGGLVLGSVPVLVPGKVLFYALEDNEASLAERLRITFGNKPWPENLICFHMESGPNKSLPLRAIDDGGLLQLDLQLRQHPDVAMVIIDTLTSVAPIHKQGGRSNAYTEDYRGYMPLRSLADRYHIPILGTWHYNKAGSIDPMEMVSGSMGLPAVGVNRLGIVRDRDSEEAQFVSFSKRGREVRWQVRYDPITCQWIKLGDAKDMQLSEQKRLILDAIEESGRPMRLADIARAADMKYNNCIQLAKRMVQDGLIAKRDSDGLYELAGKKTPNLFELEQIEAPPSYAPDLPLECSIEKCDHKGNRSTYGIYWRVLGPDGETEPSQHRDVAIGAAWSRWGAVAGD